jgi:hypothetical protein
MKLYCLWHNIGQYSDQQETFLGIYSSRELAEENQKYYESLEDGRGNKLYPVSDRDDCGEFSISDFYELDKRPF